MRRNSDDEDKSGGEFNGIEDLLSGTNGDDAAVDVHEYDEEIRVVADIPHAVSDDITVQCDGRTAAIRVASDPRPFVVRVDLPSYVDDTSGETQFNNGILEVTFDRDTDPANIGFH
ncbi:Hsp20/alpha crystallin family protein [Halorubrum ezzemoulense]|jgi:HSP20 family protein|uniref:Hsp20/alpha crystallin family protein n=1 Tax=Halorubrum ezzemoulense TaxID=337243 RepID=A0ABT4Z684_HALEZ|nr:MULTISPECIES: Hsp20/alpha crystallin family protein [Halorubrum]MDB2226077.1 Hsp20/alpha crystallin family protein [Halorubrum ezzemoulense]MDB2239420.1 Hsp20/alpha crystallin family protein [Halorubrum ezzemoulense]MDB2246331.1 Hsp20/alpha crystallin family protein [Halorubrum ezzemoulense]MDB2249983.1 Hsp20/alpha crystallin family protein [Halorubrum ezzemoulense]MDB2253166.1 Hsp20/alpha crystallin family protein [Halorubrum ezzemoulense]